MNCVNCGGKLEKEICGYCGTRNDIYLLEKGITGPAKISEEYAVGEGEITEITRDESDKIRRKQFSIGMEEYRKEKIRDFKLHILLPGIILTLIIISIILILTFFRRDVAKENIDIVKWERYNYLRMGYHFLEEGDFPSAFKNFDESVNYEDDIPDPLSYFYRGLSFYYLYLNKKIKEQIKPEKEGQNNNNEKTSKETDPSEDLIKMKENLDLAIKYKELFPEAHFYLGMYYYEIQKLDKAMEEFDKSIEETGQLWKEDKERLEKWTDAGEKLKKHTTFTSITKKGDKNILIVPPVFTEENKALKEDKEFNEINKIELPMPETVEYYYGKEKIPGS